MVNENSRLSGTSCHTKSRVRITYRALCGGQTGVILGTFKDCTVPCCKDYVKMERQNTVSI